MNFLVAINSFKGTASSRDAGNAVARGLAARLPDAAVRVLAVADGGDGTVDAFHLALGGRFIPVTVHGPLGETRDAPILILDDGAAVIEMAAASGLALVPPELRNPLHTSTFGVGEMLRAALCFGVRKIFAGLGGSATVDGGTGAAAALGIRFIDASGRSVQPSGGSLSRIVSIDASGLDPRLKEARIIALSDVDNPLLGENGAARVFGPQKGADAVAVEMLEAGLKNLAAAASPGRDLRNEPGAGAAGGLAFGFMTFLGAQLLPGASAILDAIRFDEALSWADVIITGEGRLDAQTLRGKAPETVKNRAKSAGKCVAAFTGAVDRAAGAADGYDAAFALLDAFGEAASINDTLNSLEKLAFDNAPEIAAKGTGNVRHTQ